MGGTGRGRRSRGAALVLAVGLMAGTTPPAAAGRPRVPATADVLAVALVSATATTDPSGPWCSYVADVTLTWSGSVMLWVSLHDGTTRHAPGEQLLKGSGNRTIRIRGIGAPASAEGPLLAEAFVLQSRTWVVVDDEATAPVSC